MRILCLTPWFPASREDTTGSYILQSLQSLGSLGHAFQVLVCEPWRPALFGRLHSDWRQKPGGSADFAPALTVERVHYLSAPRNLANQWSQRSFSLLVGSRLKKRIQSFRPDVIHGHTEITAELLAQTGAANGIPTVVTLHGINTATALQRPAHLRRIGRALARATRVVLVGEPLRQAFGEICGRDSHFRVVPNGFSPPSALPKPRDFRQSRIRFISISNLHEGKGIDIALKALAQLKPRIDKDWRYTVVGSGRERPALTALTEHLGLSDRVDFAGHAPQDKVYEHLASADMFILPSYREAFGIAYLEAMASGLLTFGVEGQGPQSFITDGVSGHLVAPRSVASLADAIGAALADPERSAAVAREGQRVALGGFTWKQHGEKLLKVFEEATA